MRGHDHLYVRDCALWRIFWTTFLSIRTSRGREIQIRKAFVPRLYKSRNSPTLDSSSRQLRQEPGDLTSCKRQTTLFVRAGSHKLLKRIHKIQCLAEVVSEEVAEEDSVVVTEVEGVDLEAEVVVSFSFSCLFLCVRHERGCTPFSQ